MFLKAFYGPFHSKGQDELASTPQAREAGQVGIPGTLFCSRSGMSRGSDLRRTRWGPLRPQESLGHLLEAGSPLKRGARPEAECSPALQGAAPGARRRHPSGAKGRRHSPSKEGRRVAQPEGRGNSARVPRQPALWELGGGDTAGSRAEDCRDQSWVPARGHRQERSGRKGLVGEAPQGGWGRRSACVLGGRPEVWGRGHSGSAGSCQRLQAALSPPPGAFSPVRSRARAVRGEWRRRREQPVV